MSYSNPRPHVKEGSLVMIAGDIVGIVIGRVDKFYYQILCEGVLHTVHRNDFTVVRLGYDDEE